jgi:hypothetical protein
VATQITFPEWLERMADPMLSDAVIDRIVPTPIDWSSKENR